MRRTKTISGLLFCLGVLHLVAFFAGFFSPYDFAQQDRDIPYAPPPDFIFGMPKEQCIGGLQSAFLSNALEPLEFMTKIYRNAFLCTS